MQQLLVIQLMETQRTSEPSLTASAASPMRPSSAGDTRTMFLPCIWNDGGHGGGTHSAANASGSAGQALARCRAAAPGAVRVGGAQAWSASIVAPLGTARMQLDSRLRCLLAAGARCARMMSDERGVRVLQSNALEASAARGGSKRLRASAVGDWIERRSAPIWPNAGACS